MLTAHRTAGTQRAKTQHGCLKIMGKKQIPWLISMLFPIKIWDFGGIPHVQTIFHEWTSTSIRVINLMWSFWRDLQRFTFGELGSEITRVTARNVETLVRWSSACQCWFEYNHLFGGFNPSEKYSSVGTIIPNIWKSKKWCTYWGLH